MSSEINDEDEELLHNIFSIHPQINDMYRMIIDINDHLHANLTYTVNYNNECGKFDHMLKTNTKEYHFNSREEACDFLLETYGKQ